MMHVWVSELKSTISDMIAKGELPTDVDSFEALHEYCDANMLLPIMPTDYPDDDDGEEFCHDANKIIERVNDWLANGRKE